MAITIEREFAPASRYLYDNKLMNAGFAQVDSRQDASYFGTWISPTKRILFNYCEGDCTITKCDTDAELLAELDRMEKWNAENGERRYSNGKAIGIDPGFDADLKAACIAAGLTEYVH